VSDVRKGYFRK